MSKSWVSRRRRLRAKAIQKHGKKRRMEWIGGHLCFTNPYERVPEVKEVPKPGSQAIGLAAIGMRA